MNNYIQSKSKSNQVFGVRSHVQIGDSLILSGAVHNVKLAHPEMNFKFIGNGYYNPLFENNNDFNQSLQSFKDIGLIHYGDGEKEGKNGNHIEAQTKMLCERIGIPMVDIKTRTPYIILTDDEIEWGRQFQGKWLVNANFQTFSISKYYPHWQEVIDGMNKFGLKVVQVGGNESRDFTTNLTSVEDWRGKTNLRQWLSMIYNCAGIVSPPSGIMHAGGVWEKPMVIIVGARELPCITDYPTANYIVSDCDNRGCEAQHKQDCKHFNILCPCMDISPEIVLNAIKSLI